MVPSLPLRLGCPEIPRANFCGLAALARIALSVMLSTIPAPNIGVGMRKITFFWLSASSKSGCEMLQLPASERPVITKRSWTPPSGVPFRLRMNLASRTGPLGVMKGGILFVAPSAVAMAICRLFAGLEPPNAGMAWHPLQLTGLQHWGVQQSQYSCAT